MPVEAGDGGVADVGGDGDDGEAGVLQEGGRHVEAQTGEVVLGRLAEGGVKEAAEVGTNGRFCAVSGRFVVEVGNDMAYSIRQTGWRIDKFTVMNEMKERAGNAIDNRGRIKSTDIGVSGWKDEAKGTQR
jgi:hypothetical protein